MAQKTKIIYMNRDDYNTMITSDTLSIVIDGIEYKYDPEAIYKAPVEDTITSNIQEYLDENERRQESGDTLIDILDQTPIARASNVFNNDFLGRPRQSHGYTLSAEGLRFFESDWSTTSGSLGYFDFKPGGIIEWTHRRGIMMRNGTLTLPWKTGTIATLDDIPEVPTVPAFSTSASAVGATSAAGSANTVSRGDHVHNISVASGDSNGQVKIAGQNVSVKGLGSAAYRADTYFALSGHSHTKSQITDFPTSMPANGGNADTVDNKHASDFLLYDDAYSKTTSSGRTAYNNYNTVIRSVDNIAAGDRFFGLQPDQIIVEQSVDAGVTWTPYSISDEGKRNLFRSDNGGNITIPKINNLASCNAMVRVTITAQHFNIPSGTTESNKLKYWNSTRILASNSTNGYRRYCNIDNIYTWQSTTYNRMQMTIQGARPSTVDEVEPSFTTFAVVNGMSGWSGGTSTGFSGQTFGGGETQTGQYWIWRFIFRVQAADGSFDDSKLSTPASSSCAVSSIKAYGQYLWSTDNNYRQMGTGTPIYVRNMSSREYGFNGKLYVEDNIYENGTLLSNKYLGKTAKAADSDKLNGQAASYYLNYNNLTNKPSIPAAQIQSDWTQTDSTKLDYIKNKPAVPNAKGTYMLVATRATAGGAITYEWVDISGAVLIAKSE